METFHAVVYCPQMAVSTGVDQIRAKNSNWILHMGGTQIPGQSLTVFVGELAGSQIGTGGSLAQIGTCMWDVCPNSDLTP